MGKFLADVNAKEAAAVARYFDPAGFVWEVNDHRDPPNGTAGGLRTVGAVDSFMRELRPRGERWIDGSLISPLGTANLPDETAYGLTFTIITGAAQRSGAAKVAITCATGLITHMVGPGE